MYNYRLVCKALVLLCMMHGALCIPLKAADKPYKRASVLKSYRTCMKDKNFVQARQVLTDAMRQHPEAAADPQFYKYKVDALNELIGVENRKIYLNAKPDTVTYFNYIYELYTTALQCDSVEQHALAARQAEGKRVTPKWRSAMATAMLPYRKNMLNAGKFHYQKKNYAEAFRFLNMYAQTKSSAVFFDSKGKSLLTDPSDTVDVAVLAVLSAYGSSNYQGVKNYLAESLKDEHLESQLLEIGSKSMAELNDTVEMVRLLEQGFDNYPEVEYFLMTLMKYYNDQGNYSNALQKALRMTELYPQKRDYWYMVGTELVLLSKDEDALQYFSKCIEIKADDAEAYASIGNIYLRAAHAAYAQFNVPLSDPTYSKRKAAVNSLYKQACQAFEQARKFDENHPDLWLAGLRETYFKLNRGKSLKALDKYN